MPNIELTQAESNLINYMLDNIVDDAYSRKNRLESELKINGSLDGVYGKEFKESDEKILEAATTPIALYEALRNKFPFDENVES